MQKLLEESNLEIKFTFANELNVLSYKKKFSVIYLQPLQQVAQTYFRFLTVAAALQSLSCILFACFS
jgi:hypothetical protein